ncbi:hypothetical protein CAEBREN_18479 [Caenorhabditis brenneri]|uniref:Uncharacterized protein n=1 Tax=Caenorhabditis brenneri TaxID=135651 RepID=G0NLK6_CAEBE|nr:hypothetical protein CAEBREN_18479 [Caenorhabditis brenneri]
MASYDWDRIEAHGSEYLFSEHASFIDDDVREFTACFSIFISIVLTLFIIDIFAREYFSDNKKVIRSKVKISQFDEKSRKAVKRRKKRKKKKVMKIKSKKEKKKEIVVVKKVEKEEKSRFEDGDEEAEDLMDMLLDDPAGADKAALDAMLKQIIEIESGQKHEAAPASVHMPSIFTSHN